MRLLIIEDSARLAGLMAEGLERRGFVCDQAMSLADADAAMDAARHDALILDLGLPDGDGVGWLAARRRRGDTVPALILTARGALEDRVTGLDAGADDYVVKPAEIAELAARIRALLRRPGPRANTVLENGALCFDTATRQAHFADRPLDLARRETDLLELLMRQAGTVVRRGMIEEALYNFNEPVTPNAVEAIVSRLRRRLDEAGARDMLHTIRGLGYMLKEAGA
ncbi:response regulator transcription factor [Sphingobium aquiterrae]|uniref:response regulator transcription factor n=1 Tax=Sphingobium aquiterrae TaxID=2038656 RepID=UPI00301714B6